jgi:hypothetical protein
MPAVTKMSLAEQLKRIPAATRPTVLAAIRTVKEAAPQADEITYNSSEPRSSGMMWKLVRYAVAGYNVVGIGTFTNHASLFFYRGRELDDGSGLLQGGGKDSRFITLRVPADVDQPAVKRLLKKAFKVRGTG